MRLNLYKIELGAKALIYTEDFYEMCFDGDSVRFYAEGSNGYISNASKVYKIGDGIMAEIVKGC